MSYGGANAGAAAGAESGGNGGHSRVFGLPIISNNGGDGAGSRVEAIPLLGGGRDGSGLSSDAAAAAAGVVAGGGSLGDEVLLTTRNAKRYKSLGWSLVAAAAAGILIACMVAAAVIPFVSVAPDSEASADTTAMARGLGLLGDEDDHQQATEAAAAAGAAAAAAATASSRGYLPELLARMGAEDESQEGEEGGEDDADAAAAAAPSDEEAPDEEEDAPAEQEEQEDQDQEEVVEEEMEPLLTPPWEEGDKAAEVGEAEAAAAAAGGWPSRLVVVPAVYDEWDHSKTDPSNASLPDWAMPSAENGDTYAMGPLYQRRFPEAPNYVPNNAYETAVYMKFVIDHYDNLPDATAFVQADYGVVWDAKARLNSVAEGVDRVTYQPLNVETDATFHPEYITSTTGYNPYNQDMSFIHHRTAEQLINTWLVGPWGYVDKVGDDPERNYKVAPKEGEMTGPEHVERCWNHVASQLIPDHNASEPMSLSLYCCNYFVASRDQIRKLPLETWQRLYDQFVVQGECVPGDGSPRDELRGKFDLGITMEHMAHVMFGGKELDASDDARCCGEECVLKDAMCNQTPDEKDDVADMGGREAAAAQLEHHVGRMQAKFKRYNGDDFEFAKSAVVEETTTKSSAPAKTSSKKQRHKNTEQPAVEDVVDAAKDDAEKSIAADKTRIETLEVMLHKARQEADEHKAHLKTLGIMLHKSRGEVAQVQEEKKSLAARAAAGLRRVIRPNAAAKANKPADADAAAAAESANDVAERVAKRAERIAAKEARDAAAAAAAANAVAETGMPHISETSKSSSKSSSSKSSEEVEEVEDPVKAKEKRVAARRAAQAAKAAALADAAEATKAANAKKREAAAAAAAADEAAKEKAERVAARRAAAKQQALEDEAEASAARGAAFISSSSSSGAALYAAKLAAKAGGSGGQVTSAATAAAAADGVRVAAASAVEPLDVAAATTASLGEEPVNEAKRERHAAARRAREVEEKKARKDHKRVVAETNEEISAVNDKIRAAAAANTVQAQRDAAEAQAAHAALQAAAAKNAFDDIQADAAANLAAAEAVPSTVPAYEAEPAPYPNSAPYPDENAYTYAASTSADEEPPIVAGEAGKGGIAEADAPAPAPADDETDPALRGVPTFDETVNNVIKKATRDAAREDNVADELAADVIALAEKDEFRAEHAVLGKASYSEKSKAAAKAAVADAALVAAAEAAAAGDADGADADDDVDVEEKRYNSEVATLGLDEATRLRMARRKKAMAKASVMHFRNEAVAGAARDEAMSRFKAAAAANKNHAAQAEKAAEIEKLERAALEAAGLALAEAPAGSTTDTVEESVTSEGAEAPAVDHLMTEEEVEAAADAAMRGKEAPTPAKAAAANADAKATEISKGGATSTATVAVEVKGDDRAAKIDALKAALAKEEKAAKKEKLAAEAAAAGVNPTGGPSFTSHKNVRGEIQNPIAATARDARVKVAAVAAAAAGHPLTPEQRARIASGGISEDAEEAQQRARQQQRQRQQQRLQREGGAAGVGQREDAAGEHPSWWGKADNELTKRERQEKQKQQNANRRERERREEAREAAEAARAEEAKHPHMKVSVEGLDFTL